MKPKNVLYRGFTLIELLIVVAIIAILAAIAVPNFLEAQTRAKVSRVKADMRSLATGMESYRVDNNAYIAGNNYGVAGSRPSVGANDPKVLERLSTPIAYLTTAFFEDPFKALKRSNTLISSPPLTAAQTNVSGWTDTAPSAGDAHLYRTYLYISTCRAQNTNISPSAGNNPSGIMRTIAGEPPSTGYIVNSASPMQALVNAGGVVATFKKDDAIGLVYDPSNGTVSFGNIWRTGGSPDSRDNLIGAADLSNK